MRLFQFVTDIPSLGISFALPEDTLKRRRRFQVRAMFWDFGLRFGRWATWDAPDMVRR